MGQKFSMGSLIPVEVHETQFPDRVLEVLRAGLRARQLNPKFHYQTYRQAGAWLALHEQFSPVRTEPGCQEIYERCFEAAIKRVHGKPVELIALGCGGGQKEVRLGEVLGSAAQSVFLTAVDTSWNLVLATSERTARILPPTSRRGVVCDIGLAKDLELLFPRRTHTSRVVTAFGLVPNFEPDQLVQKLASLLAFEDTLLLSANLVMEAGDLDGVQAGVRGVLSQYDNPPTRNWLGILLGDLGISSEHGQMCFRVEEYPSGSGWVRIAAVFEFKRGIEVRLDNERFRFDPGEELLVFYTYRHTPNGIRRLVTRHGLSLLDEWISPSGEGVFLVTPAQA
jgi:uncharacterized SAM-dependent methyltransferase